MYLEPFPKGLTLICESCDLKRKVKPDRLPTGDPTRKVFEMARFRVPHPESALLNVQHENYMNDEASDDSKRYPVWDRDLT
jgi:hypothetical protein